MHFNPVKRGLVESPKEWEWSSYRFYWKGEKGLCPPNPGWQLRAGAMGKNQKGAHALSAAADKALRHPQVLLRGVTEPGVWRDR